MANEPVEPTAAQLRAEIESLKAQLSGMVPGAEAEKLKLELAEAREELKDLKALPPPAPAAKSEGFFPKLF